MSEKELGSPADVSKPSKVDWEAVERDYRAGILSLREIGSRHGCTEGAIRKRAKKEGWTRDLEAKIQQKAEDLVRKQAVRDEVRSSQSANEKEIVEANAQAILTVRMSHRSDIAASRDLSRQLLEELKFQTNNMPLLLQLGDLLRCENENGQDKLNDLYQKLISLTGRSKTMKDLVDSLKTLIGLEREAYNIGAEPDKPKELETMSDDELMAEIIRLNVQRSGSFPANGH